MPVKCNFIQYIVGIATTKLIFTVDDFPTSTCLSKLCKLCFSHGRTKCRKRCGYYSNILRAFVEDALDRANGDVFAYGIWKEMCISFLEEKCGANASPTRNQTVASQDNPNCG